MDIFISLKSVTTLRQWLHSQLLTLSLIFFKYILKNWDSVLAVYFDSMTTMSGWINGVQIKLKEQNNEIIYVHCYAHCLNLTLIDAVCEKNSKQVVKNLLIFHYFRNRTIYAQLY